jgi:hypothetical protein
MTGIDAWSGTFARGLAIDSADGWFASVFSILNSGRPGVTHAGCTLGLHTSASQTYSSLAFR